MRKLSSEETILTGQWILSCGSIISDSVSERIEWLIENYLIEIGQDESGWSKLYKDPEDNRYWELTYPHSEIQGGGPPQLKITSLGNSNFRN
ncbi:Imm27 family immunity protein [Larkinella arboricola]|uniref:Imm27 family immunity protein n=1 Tax=Larkinella arboricola TaxID=643671 RepID=UPI000DBA172D